MRGVVLFTIVAGALLAMAWQPVISGQGTVDFPQLSYVTTAHQLGVVSYRDPAGAISPDGKHFAYAEGRFVRVIPIRGGAPVTLPPRDEQVRYLEWTSNDTVVPVPRPPSTFKMRDGKDACIVDRRLVIPCGGEKQILEPNVDVYGPIAFSPDGNTVYFSTPNSNGMVELWSAVVKTGRTRRLSNFDRDAYAPTVAADGTVVFKVQSYRTHLADVSLSGGPTRQLTTFQSETPSYHPTQSLLAFTYGSWRRVIDDAKYPDIAQDIGTIDLSTVPADAPGEVIARSESEDQAMAWSPNGKWIAFHSHREMSDDVWLRPADRGQPDKRITFLGRGAETGWPRWSPDGKHVLFAAGRKGAAKSGLYVVGVDQDRGSVTSEVREIPVTGLQGDITHAEWLGSDTIAALAKDAPGSQTIVSVGVEGGAMKVIHRYATEHHFSGLGASVDGRWIAFAAPANDGFYQIFKKEIAGNAPAMQLTTDPSNKTQPTFSVYGSRVAFTVWSYEATFWAFHP